MILRIFTLTLEPENPVQFSLPELRTFLTLRLKEFTEHQPGNSAMSIHRYPALQCKLLKNTIIVVGICQGADFLKQISDNQEKISSGKNTCSIRGQDPAIRNEKFGISGTSTTYEFLTPWQGLNQQNTKKFYELKGKPDRDIFIQKILLGGLATLAKSLDYKNPEPVTCEQKLRFRKDWIDNSSVMVFTGRFQTNLQVPDYLGMGQSVSLGFGTLRRIPDSPLKENEENTP